MAKTLIGVMGPGQSACEADISNAYELGAEIAKHGWVVLSGGRDSGVMDAVNRGAKDAQGLTLGILPDSDRSAVSSAVDIAVVTGMGSARNNINVLSSEVVVACGLGSGTASEIALALKAEKPVVLLGTGEKCEQFFSSLDQEKVFVAKTPVDAAQVVKRLLAA